MRTFHTFVFLMLLSIMTRLTCADVREAEQKGSRAKTYVISNAFCESSLPAEDRMEKERLEDVHSYAQLKDDPRSALPYSFTICSTIMTTSCQKDWWPYFFNILDNNRSSVLAAARRHGSLNSLFFINSAQGSSRSIYRGGGSQDGKFPPMFHNQWTSSCLAINTTSGFIQWVVEGTLVLTMTSAHLPQTKPTNHKLM